MLTNRNIREGEAELSRLLRWVDREVGPTEAEGEVQDVIALLKEAKKMWQTAPPELKRAVKANLRMLWVVSGPLLFQAARRALALVRGGTSPLAAARIVGTQLNLRPRRVAGPGSPGPLGPTHRINQYVRRQEQRGRRPGQDPRRGQR